uniref:Uncharacterized protein n=1 Tax=Arundo donax TaxID=35708 RepID=A0A0A9G5G7_ARUDO
MTEHLQRELPGHSAKLAAKLLLSRPLRHYLRLHKLCFISFARQSRNHVELLVIDFRTALASTSAVIAMKLSTIIPIITNSLRFPVTDKCLWLNVQAKQASTTASLTLVS